MLFCETLISFWPKGKQFISGHMNTNKKDSTNCTAAQIAKETGGTDPPHLNAYTEAAAAAYAIFT